MDKYDVIVIGGGHAGIEAALASARLGCKTLMVIFKKDTIGLMSCNPAIGGVGKGQLVKEVDALGGEMGKAADACAIQFRLLNASKGAAAQSTRAQIDRKLYQKYMEKTITKQKNLFFEEAEATGIIVRDNQVVAVKAVAEIFYTKCVVITTGTFLNALIHIGKEEYRGGRRNEPASMQLSESLKRAGLELGRFKTCTPLRLDGKTIDFSRMKVQPPDANVLPFSFSNTGIKLNQLPCYLTYSNLRTHQIIRLALEDKELLHIISQGINPRYCPSIEEKVMRFPEKNRHQLFIEPEGLECEEYYANGLFTFLPQEVQQEFLATIVGLENARITKPGYGIEYDFSPPTQLFPNLETKKIRNLFLAGQINGTTGYEEAAAQGLIAGINAALKTKDKPLLILNRSTSYIGVLIDDLVTKGTDEPYRMFTSRVEYRLILREDNADLRLREIGYNLGLVRKEDYLKMQQKLQAIKRGIEFLRSTRIRPTPEANEKLVRSGTSPIKKIATLEEILKRPQVSLEGLKDLNHVNLDAFKSAWRQIEIEVKYSGFIQRQLKDVERFKNLEKIKLPEDLDYGTISGLSSEIKEKLNRFKPLNLGQASRISGVTPVAITILMVYLRKICPLKER